MSNSRHRLIGAETAGFRVSILPRTHIVALIVAFIPVVEQALTFRTAESHVEAEFLHHSQIFRGENLFDNVVVRVRPLLLRLISIC